MSIESDTPVQKPTLIFDGECGFCARWADRWKNLTGDAVDYIPSQQCKDRFEQIPEGGYDESVWLVEPDGKTTAAAGAVFRALSLGAQKKWLHWAYQNISGFKAISEGIYHWVSNHRPLAEKLDTRFIPEPCDSTRSYKVSGSLLLRGIGLVYLVALVSLRLQIEGLIGSEGILPAQLYFRNWALLVPDWFHRILLLPSIFWLDASDSALRTVCNIGIACAVMLMLGILPALNSIALYIIYLSLATASQIFLAYQWDSLLLEAGFLAIFLSPIGLTIGRAQPSRIAMFLIRWLLFRLMLLSGLVKIAYGDATWRGLSALRVHYETQPLPTWTSWYMHLQPGWFAVLSTAFVLIVEIATPLFIFAVRRRRLAALSLLVLLQLLIIATGNYGFFNLLTLVLCLSLVDDAAWKKLRLPRVDRQDKPRWRWTRWLVIPVLALVLLISIPTFAFEIGGASVIPSPLKNLAYSMQSFRVVNGYGLFREMTTHRDELIIEGSNDGKTWLAYEFKNKPGDVNSQPKFCAPGMPRLDWQMWFAALNPDASADVLDGLLSGLHRGSKPVEDLLASNPFPDHPPKYLRIEAYKYRFTTSTERAQSGAWWHRELIGQVDFASRPGS